MKISNYLATTFLLFSFSIVANASVYEVFPKNRNTCGPAISASHQDITAGDISAQINMGNDIHFNAGCYMIDRPIFIKSCVRIYGDSDDQTILLANNFSAIRIGESDFSITSHSDLESNDYLNCNQTNLVIDHMQIKRDGPSDSALVRADNTSGIHLHNLKVINSQSPEGAIRFIDVSDSIIENNIIKSYSKLESVFDESQNRYRLVVKGWGVFSSTKRLTYEAGVNVGGITVRNNLIEDERVIGEGCVHEYLGLLNQNCDVWTKIANGDLYKFHIPGNQPDGSAADANGIAFDSQGIALVALTTGLIENNTVLSAGSEGIDINHSEYIVVKGNVISNVYAFGIKLMNGTQHCTVENNYIKKVGLAGIVLGPGGYPCVTSNGSQCHYRDTAFNDILNNRIDEAGQGSWRNPVTGSHFNFGAFFNRSPAWGIALSPGESWYVNEDPKVRENRIIGNSFYFNSEMTEAIFNPESEEEFGHEFKHLPQDNYIFDNDAY